MSAVAPSKKAIDRAGTTLRDWWLDDAAGVSRGVREALDMVLEYRASFGYPLKKVNVGLRQFASRESPEVIVSSRLKRTPTIIDKLARQRTMKITRMQDIGGCRVILQTPAEVQGVLRRIQKNWDVVEIYDYVRRPKPGTGYRATHVVVRRDERLCEIQLRTPSQHRWALQVERTGSRLGLPGLKDGVGPDDLVRYFELASYVLGLEDAGTDADEADDALLAEFRDLRLSVAPYFQQARRRS